MQPQPEVREWMRKAQILAAPSIVARSGDAEGLPTVLCEAQAIGLPVVSFIGPGVNEAVVADETALLVRPTDEHALGEAILRLLGNDEMRARFGEAGQKRAAECFDIRTQTALLEDKYDEVLREDARRRG
jgi:glycosyltransferase involved in cell wall biosynthesis